MDVAVAPGEGETGVRRGNANTVRVVGSVSVVVTVVLSVLLLYCCYWRRQNNNGKTVDNLNHESVSNPASAEAILKQSVSTRGPTGGAVSVPMFPATIAASH